MKFHCSHVVLCLAAISSVSLTARILALFNYNARSHFIMFEPLLRGLANRGHEVFVVGHFPQKTPIPNYTDINVQDSIPSVVNNFTVEYVRSFGLVNQLRFIWEKTLEMCETVMNHPEVQELIRNSDTHKFDLIITHIFGPDCFLGFSHIFNAPFISLVTSVALPWTNDRVGNPDNPSYIPNFFLPFTQRMNFGERIINTIFNEIMKIGNYYFSELPMDKLARKYLGEDIPSITELKKNTSLIMANSHFSLNTPRPTIPAFVEVGGLHLKTDGKLPKDLKTYLDNSKEGVIYFCLGSLIKSSTLPEDKKQMFIEAFSNTKLNVLWKIDEISGLPDNVKTYKWFPQFEILKHPNVRMFITHGGLMGTMEGVYTGVPMIGVPMFADQELNINVCVMKGIAILLDFDTLTTEKITNAIDAILNNLSYRKNAKKLSELFRDRPHTALETAIYWTEYVIRHRGARHMRSAAIDLPWYQYLLLDVILVLLVGTIVSIYILYYAVKVSLRLLLPYLEEKRLKSLKFISKEE